MTKGQQAKQNFLDGYNCAQAVACAFSEELGVPPETVALITSGFGGGMAKMREVCGCISGAAFVLSMLRGSADARDTAGKARANAAIQRVAEEFRAQNGSIVCRELLGLVPLPNPEAAPLGKKRPCAELCELAADALAAELAANP